MTCACLSRYTTDVAERTTAAADYMKTTLRKLEHVVTFRTLLPLRYVRKELHAWVTRTYFIMYLAFALHAGCVLALGTSAYPSADVLEANESCAVIVRAINQFWSPELLHLEAEFLSIFLRENRTADVKGDGNLTALRRKDKNVVQNYSETMEGAVC